MAIHEAGHAVASVLLGLGLREVTIIPDEEALGRVVPRDDGPSENEEVWAGTTGWKLMRSVSLPGTKRNAE